MDLDSAVEEGFSVDPENVFALEVARGHADIEDVYTCIDSGVDVAFDRSGHADDGGVNVHSSADSLRPVSYDRKPNLDQIDAKAVEQFYAANLLIDRIRPARPLLAFSKCHVE
jgi:hypothetical protein